MFSIFLLLALLFGAFFLSALRGAFFFGSGCLTVSAALPANRLLRRAGADALVWLLAWLCFSFCPTDTVLRLYRPTTSALLLMLYLLSNNVPCSSWPPRPLHQ